MHTHTRTHTTQTHTHKHYTCTHTHTHTHTHTNSHQEDISFSALHSISHNLVDATMVCTQTSASILLCVLCVCVCAHQKHTPHTHTNTHSTHYSSRWNWHQSTFCIFCACPHLCITTVHYKASSLQTSLPVGQK